MKNTMETQQTESPQQSDVNLGEGNSETGKSPKKWAIISAAIAVLTVALIGAGVGILNTPEKRVTRQLQTAYKYLQEGDYEKAALAFEQVIAVDKKCIEAYAKGIEAYAKSGNKEKLQNLYERAMEQIGELDEEILAKNLKYVVDIYLSVKDVYGNNPVHMAEVLEQGLKLTDGNGEIKDLLIDTYLEIATKKEGDGKYADALEMFDRLLELDRENNKILTRLGACLNPYIEELLDVKKYDEIRALAKKYPEVPGVDFEAVIKED